MTDPVIIGVDLGGTQIRAARLTRQLDILEVYKTKTLAAEGLEPSFARIVDAIRVVWPTDGTPVAGIGISAPGPLNPITGVLVAPPNLPGWHNVPLADRLHEIFKVPVYCGNDANVAALAEVALGAARGYRFVIYLTISTGVGSGIINDGRLILGRDGLGGEAGHIQFFGDKGQVSSLEREAAGPALARAAVARLKAGEDSILKQQDINAINAEDVGRAAQAGDALAVAVVERAGFLIGLGIVSLLHLFNPEIIVIGGGVSKIGDLLFKPMHEAIQKYALDSSYWTNMPIVAAALEDDVSIYGAAALVITHGGQAVISDVLKALEEESKNA
jgi:glucokinase